MRSCVWVLVYGMVTPIVTTVWAETREPHGTPELVRAWYAPADTESSVCCAPNYDRASSEGCGCGSNHWAGQLWADYCQQRSCTPHGASRAPAVFDVPHVQPRALINPRQPCAATCCPRSRRSPGVWVRGLLGWTQPCVSSRSHNHHAVPLESDSGVGPTPTVDDNPVAPPDSQPPSTILEPPSAASEASPAQPSVIVPVPAPKTEHTPKTEPVPKTKSGPMPTPESASETAPESETLSDPTPPPAQDLKDESQPAPQESPTLDAPVPADVIPNPLPPTNESSTRPSNEPSAKEPAKESDQDLQPAVPDNVLPPSRTPKATPTSRHDPVGRAAPTRSAYPRSDQTRTR